MSFFFNVFVAFIFIDPFLQIIANHSHEHCRIK